ncbi:hypothetical protein PENPOL_c016G00292 [Penicillium polonicum]|uniref:Reverse transcriptase Ty1/copia-type domain-containing protein n=1 Tax=Penicillium polonicum TaxID=60169 RepID=A0A1V6NA61_PENPO|nr:hypothetical protein PENPOL_c016G00292 [Penicillium polonicum]
MAQADSCVFYKSNCVVCVYVDDFFAAAANSHEIDQVQRALETEFQLNDLGTPRSFLGIQNLSDEEYADESQASLESLSRQRTSRRGNKSTIRHHHRIIDIPDGQNATGYRVCAGHVESLHISATIAPLGRPA